MRVLMTRPRYWCPDCDAVLIKPPRLINGQRFHSGYCTTPMEPVMVVPRTGHREVEQ
jgi:hypothetical protein